MGLWLRCAVRPSASRLPHPRARRAPESCRFPGFPVGFHRLRGHLAVIRWSARVASPFGSHRPGPATPPRSTWDSGSDIAARSSLPSVGGPPPRRCSSRVQHRSRRALGLRDVALSPRSGRLQGVSPPTSPCPALALPTTRDQFLPWVCLPFEASPPPPWVPSVSRRSDPAPGLRLGRVFLSVHATDGRGRLSGGGSCDRRRSRPPWGSRRQRAAVAN